MLDFECAEVDITGGKKKRYFENKAFNKPTCFSLYQNHRLSMSNIPIGVHSLKAITIFY